MSNPTGDALAAYEKGRLRDTENGCDVWTGSEWVHYSSMRSSELNAAVFNHLNPPGQGDPLPCPFCWTKPKHRQGKTRSCQLHGEPSAPAIVYCDNVRCRAKPRVEDGDCYQSGGYKAALSKAITSWNNRQHIEPVDDNAIYSLLCDAIAGFPSDHNALQAKAAFDAIRPYLRPTTQATGKNAAFQSRVAPWMEACFGSVISGDKEERNHRFLEESLELVQACGATRENCLLLVDYVYGRPAGEPGQEVGGVMVTLAALCLANALSMHGEGETELGRIWGKIEQIRRKQATKPGNRSPLPQGKEWGGFKTVIQQGGSHD